MREDHPKEDHTPVGPIHDHPKEAEPTPHAPSKTRVVEEERLITALAGVHTGGKVSAIPKIEPVGTHLFYVEYTYTVGGGPPRAGNILVYDNGEKTHVFGGQ